MGWLLRATDAIADWLIHGLNARTQLRVGIWLVLGSIPIYVYLPWSGEPPVIYLMSAVALTLSGITMVIGAEVLEKNEDSDDESD